MMAPVPSPLRSLRTRAGLVVVVYGLIMVLGAWMLGRQWTPALVGRWALGAGIVLGYEIAIFVKNLGKHRDRTSGQVLATLGPGNALTLLRGLMNGLLAGFLLTPWPEGGMAWLPALFYTTAGIADYFDGYLARRTGQDTALGELLDMEFDALGVLIVATLAVHFGQWPVWLMAVGLARYLFILGLALRRRANLKVYDLHPSTSRRAIAGLQMGFMSVVLWPIAPPALATLAGWMFGIPFLVVFFRDWLVASGQLDPQNPHYRHWRQRIMRLLTTWLPLGARLLTAMAAGAMLVDTINHFEQQVADFVSFGISSASFLSAFFLLLLVLSVPFLVLGVAARITALVLLLPVGFIIAASGFSSISIVALMGAIYILIFGTGAMSLWGPEDRFFSRRAGETN